METRAHRCDRLLIALEDLVAQEAWSIAARDYSALRAVQERAGPLVEGLASVATAADFELRRRVVTLNKFRERNLELLAAQIADAREELRVVEDSRNRVARVAPAYRQAPIPWGRRQLFARG